MYEKHVKDVAIVVEKLIDYCHSTCPSSRSIGMAPSALRKLSPGSFEPLVVSIGPLHGKDENLQRFEVRKASFVQVLLDQTATKTNQTIKKILEDCVETVINSVGIIREWYAGINCYNDLELAEMMVKDACFILQFIRKISESGGSSSVCTSLDNYICYDLVLLENQIPFFVLNYIFTITILKLEKCGSLTEFIHPLLKLTNIFEREIEQGTNRSNTEEYLHILGYIHNFYKPRSNIPSSFPRSNSIHSAVELVRAGVMFKPNQNELWPLAMKVEMHRCSCILWFLSKPTLRMQKLRINRFTELVFRNLIAYEQSSKVDAYVTSYAKAMDMLIDTHEDIAKLVRSKVIVNHLGSNEEAANMINGICKEVVWEDFFYGVEWEKLGSHYNNYWPRKVLNEVDNLKRAYFNSPWCIIALFAGVTLFALSVVQTLFEVKSAGK